MKHLSKNKKQTKCYGLFSISVMRIMAKFFIILFTVFTIASPVLALGNTVEANKNNTDNKINENIKSGELERFVDDAFKNNMQKYSIPGAVISIVKDGRIILLKGYGYADLDKKTPAVPNKTLFRIGSVTKLFTANAAMQLVENGKINLNDDVNNYLINFKIKNDYSKSITMAQLLTHTSGIDSDVIGDLSQTESEVKPLSQFLKKRMLPVVREPGQFIQYSSYGMALAGCIVEDISGMNCSDYIDKHIFIFFYVISMMTWGERLRYEVPLDVKLLLCIPIITSLTTIFLIAISIINWKNNLGSLFFRINTSIVAIVGLIFVWLYNYYNLLGFKY